MLPLQPSGLLELNSDNITFSSDRKLTGIYFTPEVKWFLEKSDKRPAPRGLYIGAYLRYSDTRYTADLSAEASGTDASGSIRTALQIDLFEYGVGPSMGYQFLAIKDRLVVDAIFFAPRWAFYDLRLKAELQGDGQLADGSGTGHRGKARASANGHKHRPIHHRKHNHQPEQPGLPLRDQDRLRILRPHVQKAS